MKSTVRTIYALEVSQNKGICEIRIRGNGFLYNMVRIIAGTLIYVSEGKRSLEDVRRAIETGARDFAGVTLPPDGLYLSEVLYGDPPDCTGFSKISISCTQRSLANSAYGKTSI